MLKLLTKILFLPIILWSAPSFAQSDSTWHSSVYIEAGGAGGIGSFNIEHYSFEKEYINIGARFGLGTSRLRNFEDDFQPDYFVPFGIFTEFKVIKKRRNPLLIYTGVGLIYASTVQVNEEYKAERIVKLNSYFQVGATYIISKKLLLRLSYSPIISRGYGLNHWGALSIGHTF
ncbi:MAG: hypothetical protein HRT57_08270 [Crocinitomicaceae bacterium]|nr:hypothetical protein [Crocinitomicaceae bacterium]